MIDTVIAPLGLATACGIDAVTQCNFFKRVMRNEIGAEAEGAWLRMMPSQEKSMGMVVEYHPDVQNARQWAHEAQGKALFVWGVVAGTERLAMRQGGAGIGSIR